MSKVLLVMSYAFENRLVSSGIITSIGPSAAWFFHLDWPKKTFVAASRSRGVEFYLMKMSVREEKVAVIGDLKSSSPSPQTFFLKIPGDDLSSRPFSGFPSDNINKGPLPNSDKQRAFWNLEHRDGKVELGASDDSFLQSTMFNVATSVSREDLAERMASRAGFNVPKLDYALIMSPNMVSTPEFQSPTLGLSPTTSLECPVFLSNPLAQSSPTTGKYLMGQSHVASPLSISKYSGRNKNQPVTNVEAGPLELKPHQESSSLCYLDAPNKEASTTNHQQNLPTVEKTPDFVMGNELSPRPGIKQDGEREPKGEFSYVAVGVPPGGQLGGPPEDGYNWKKYGQKEGKGSEYLRGYYKCRHPDCQVRKRVDWSHEGHIKVIIYNGKDHKHPKPLPNHRSAITQNGAVGPDSKNDGLEATSSAAAFCGKSTSMQARDVPRFNDNEKDDSESKIRKFDSYAMEMNAAASSVVRKPKLVFQVASEVDVIDDGYFWRKYGHKVVKGKQYPRSYYKCTSKGCTVRKQVERASHDCKFVITSYEGKHNHDVPAARNCRHDTSVLSGPAATHRRPEHSQMQDSLPRFDGSASLSAFGMSSSSRELRQPTGSGFPMGMGHQPSHLGLSPLNDSRCIMLPKEEPKEEPMHPDANDRD